jgi:hypothetical protein
MAFRWLAAILSLLAAAGFAYVASGADDTAPKIAGYVAAVGFVAVAATNLRRSRSR